VSPSATVTDTTDYAYDVDGERYCTVSPVQVAAGVTCPAAGGAAKAGTTTTVYDAAGEATSMTDPDGNVTRHTYTADGEVATATDAAGHVTTHAYNRDVLRNGQAGLQDRPHRADRDRIVAAKDAVGETLLGQKRPHRCIARVVILTCFHDAVLAKFNAVFIERAAIALESVATG